MQLTWERKADALFGWRYDLAGLPEGACASAYKRKVTYFAHAFVNGRYMSHQAGTLNAAMRRLEREIDKRSIGLLGIDDVTFERQ